MSEIRTIGEIMQLSGLGKRPERCDMDTLPESFPETEGASIISIGPENRNGKTETAPVTCICPTRQASREILQSYLVTSALYDFDVYEKRILYNIIRFAQKELEGIRFRDNLRKIDHSLKGYVKVTLPISDFLKEGSKNHRRIRDALRRLQFDSFTYMDKDTWESITLIAYPKVEKYKGMCLVSFLVSERVWDVLLNFSKGYSKFYFDVAFSLESVYSMRLYEMLSSQSHAITYSIENLRKFFRLDKPEADPKHEQGPKGSATAARSRYSNTSDMIRKVIEPAREELDEKSPVTFTYETIRKGRKITGIIFNPVRQDNRLTAREQFRRDTRRFGCSIILSEQELNVLYETGFSKKGIDNNLDVFVSAKRFLPDFILEITELQGLSRSKENPCGWFIEALKGKVSDSRESL